MKKRLDAFTITELLVVTLLTLVTVVAAFRIIGITNEQYQSYRGDNEVYLKIGQFGTVFNRDFNQAIVIEKKGLSLILHFDNHKILYEFDAAHVTRKLLFEAGREEIFDLTEVTLIGFFNQKEIYDGWIDNVSIGFQLEGKKKLLTFFKTCSAKELCAADYANRH